MRSTRSGDCFRCLRDTHYADPVLDDQLLQQPARPLKRRAVLVMRFPDGNVDEVRHPRPALRITGFHVALVIVPLRRLLQ